MILRQPEFRNELDAPPIPSSATEMCDALELVVVPRVKARRRFCRAPRHAEREASIGRPFHLLRSYGARAILQDKAWMCARPHIGLAITYLFDGRVAHRDSEEMADYTVR
jgi:redox-sensitive bicupin YhaK (pirin superfamily)